ncbi:unnamed protein product [Sphenostylis stenocarpa]|uniref:Uncharacterized protein n=1 Tax=Sphenostylis stenocarpa TaxID=92480 RepID=A0AA86S1X7_9FABA|nr:unnamed protein product [Sphenostylis stenocarpa]
MDSSSIFWNRGQILEIRHSKEEHSTSVEEKMESAGLGTIEVQQSNEGIMKSGRYEEEHNKDEFDWMDKAETDD